MLTSCESFFRLQPTPTIDLVPVICRSLDHLLRCVRQNDPDFRVGMVSYDYLNIGPLVLKNILQIFFNFPATS